MNATGSQAAYGADEEGGGGDGGGGGAFEERSEVDERWEGEEGGEGRGRGREGFVTGKVGFFFLGGRRRLVPLCCSFDECQCACLCT
jgi:hypothetical protein